MRRKILPLASVPLVTVLMHLLPGVASAAVTVFFNTNQIASLVATGTTSETISSEGYQFTYTRDKLFTGGVGMTNPIGRQVRIPWPSGVEAQAVTAGPQTGGARLSIQRVDGALFDVTAITFQLLANTAGAGARLEIMPIVNGEDAYNDPVYFEATGYYGSQFSYNTSPNILGTTVALTNAESYKLSLYVDFALTALTLESPAPNVNHAPTDVWLSGATVLENEPADTWIGSFATADPDADDVFTYALVAGAGSDDNGSFAIQGGDLLSAQVFNYEVKSHYSVRVETTDQGLLSTQGVCAITVVDVDETPVCYAPFVSAPGSMVLAWSSVTNHVYSVLVATNLLTGFSVLASNIPATPLVNTYTDAAATMPQRYWKVTTEP